MAMTTLAFSPRFPSLNLTTGSYSSSETRLDFSLSLVGSEQIVDHAGNSLSDLSWSLRIYEGSSSVRAENDGQGAGSIRYRPPSPILSDSSGACVVQADLSAAAFSSLLAVCMARRLPERIHVEVDGLEDDGAGRLRWDTAAQSRLVVTSLSMGTDLGT